MGEIYHHNASTETQAAGHAANWNGAQSRYAATIGTQKNVTPGEQEALDYMAKRFAKTE